MRARGVRASLLGLSVATTALIVPTAASAGGPWDAYPGAPRHLDARGRTIQQVCPERDRGPHDARCLLNWVVTDGKGGAPKPIDGKSLLAAYNVPASAKSGGAIIALVDAYGDDTALEDLQAFRTANGLPTITACSGLPKSGGAPRLAVVDQTGGSPPPAAKTSASVAWTAETALDTEMASLMCPDCSILLIEAQEQINSQLDSAVDFAASVPGVVAVSNSYGWPEKASVQGDPFSLSDNPHYNHSGILVVAATGDQDYNTQGEGGVSPSFPASSQYVFAVGGTTLFPDASSSRMWNEVAWNDGVVKMQGGGSGAEGGGSGCSLNFPQPAYQMGLSGSCAKRATSDVSAVADYIATAGASQATGGGVEVVCTRCAGATNTMMYEAGVQGTSIASPLVAGLMARLGLASTIAADVGWVYSHGSAFNDITMGSTDPSGKCTNSVLCNAGKGWDGPDGDGARPTARASRWPGAGVARPVEGDAGVGEPRRGRCGGGVPEGGVIVHPIIEGGVPGEGDAPGGSSGGCGCFVVSGAPADGRFVVCSASRSGSSCSGAASAARDVDPRRKIPAAAKVSGIA